MCLIKQGEFLVFLDEASLIDAEDDAVGAYAEHLFIGKSDDDAKICASSDLLIYLRRETLKVITSICLIHTLSERICAHLMLITAVQDAWKLHKLPIVLSCVGCKLFNH